MKKLLVISLASLMLSGCLYQTVNSYDIMRASAVCNGIDDVEAITADSFGSEFVICKSKGSSENLGETYKNLKVKQ